MKQIILLLLFFSSCAPSGESFSPSTTQSRQAIEAGAPSHLTSDSRADSNSPNDRQPTGTQSEQFIDPRCERDGCSGELCRMPAINEEDNENSLCEWHDYYACYDIPNCTFNENSCGWEISPEFISCLEDYQAPSEVLNQFTGNNVLSLINGEN